MELPRIHVKTTFCNLGGNMEKGGKHHAIRQAHHPEELLRMISQAKQLSVKKVFLFWIVSFPSQP